MKRANLIAAAFAFGLGSASSLVAAAPCAGFPDVQDTDSFCSAVHWLKNRQITFGCGVGTAYCPFDNVTRAQMALFMNRMGRAISPQFYGVTQNDFPATASVPVGGRQLYCVMSTPVPAATHPRTARARAYMSLEASGADRLDMFLMYSVDGQPFVFANFVSQTVRNPNGPQTLAWASNPVPMVPGSTYAFAIAVGHAVGTAALELGHSECLLDVTVINANPTSPPFDE